jgi:hypothetical protein
VIRNESAGLVDLGTDDVVTSTETHNITAPSNSGQGELTQSIIEAQGWQRDQTGNIVLMTQISNPAPVSQYTTVCTSVRG